MTKHEKVKAILEQIKELFHDLPEESGSVQFSVSVYSGPTVSIHGHKTYDSGTAAMQELGCGTRSKQIWPEGRTVLQSYHDGVGYTVFADSLPPTCRLEKVIEKIPKKQTVDTGEFIEVERVKVICSETDRVVPVSYRDPDLDPVEAVREGSAV